MRMRQSLRNVSGKKDTIRLYFKYSIQIDCPQRESHGRSTRNQPMQLPRASISTVRRRPNMPPSRTLPACYASRTSALLRFLQKARTCFRPCRREAQDELVALWGRGTVLFLLSPKLPIHPMLPLISPIPPFHDKPKNLPSQDPLRHLI